MDFGRDKVIKCTCCEIQLFLPCEREDKSCGKCKVQNDMYVV